MDILKLFKAITLSVIAALLLVQQSMAAHSRNDFTAICYHSVRTLSQGDLSPDQFALASEHLLAQFEWLHANDFHPVSFDDILNAHKGVKPLPDKAVLLSFDDGYRNFYTTIYPLLKLYNYPAIFALVGSWLEVKPEDMVQYGEETLSRAHFLTWPQIKEMQDSGLVEFASHSYDLHRGILGNPQGNEQPAAITRKYDLQNQTYESDSHFKKRIHDDLARNSRLMEEKTGVRPRIIVWPYGAYSKETQEIAASLGMEYNFLLGEEQDNSIDTPQLITRELIEANPNTEDFAYMLNRTLRPDPERMVHIDLDYVYDDDPAQLARNLDLLLDRIKAYDISTVYLQAFADPDGNGNVDALYFPNRYLPMRADLFNRVSWQLRTRTGVQVYAWMPVLAFDLGEDHYTQYGVKEFSKQSLRSSQASYKRLSPFHATNRKIIHEIYADLGRYTHFYGILFHDDAYLTDFEDFSTPALDYYRQHGIKATLEEMTSTPHLVSRLATLKTEYLIDFTHELADTLRIYRPELRTSRNMYVRPVLQPESEQWFAQNLEKFVANYDTTAIMAMPYMEQVTTSHRQWFTQLLHTVKTRIPPFDPKNPKTPNLSKVLFELQAVDWEKKQPIPDSVLVEQIQFLLQNGINKVGYYPDTFHKNEPDLEQIRAVFSLRTFPYRRQ